MKLSTSSSQTTAQKGWRWRLKRIYFMSYGLTEDPNKVERFARSSCMNFGIFEWICNMKQTVYYPVIIILFILYYNLINTVITYTVSHSFFILFHAIITNIITLNLSQISANATMTVNFNSLGRGIERWALFLLVEIHARIMAQPFWIFGRYFATFFGLLQSIFHKEFVLFRLHQHQPCLCRNILFSYQRKNKLISQAPNQKIRLNI
eukprot:TRINITY_DN932_c1_g1_i3.p2 TRINITY_DN932_c1_g1~~TRINITY_DN932_c1_g1_i3.p2  ORF type:complete len:207 (-),score=-15.17 TRINITY_DN932_c1_g1_i3:1303-1923(-)